MRNVKRVSLLLETGADLAKCIAGGGAGYPRSRGGVRQGLALDTVERYVELSGQYLPVWALRCEWSPAARR